MAEKNILEQFATYNCLFTLSVASPGEVNSQSYRSANPLPRIVASSAGRFDGSRVQTAYGAPEFIIDNVKIEAICAPKPGVGNTQWQKLSFDIYEPYSMGLFLQSCQVGALEAGYKSYLDNAAYVMRVEFSGWTGPGSSMKVGPYNWLIKLTKSDFTVDASGSTYKVEGIAYNQASLSEQVNKTMNEVKLIGKTSNEALVDHPEFSLLTYLRNREKQLVADGYKTYEDQYDIQFVDDCPFGKGPGNDLEFKPDSQGGITVFGREGDVREGDKVKRNNMSIIPKEQAQLFSQGTTLTNIIDNVILNTKEARENATDPGKLDGQGRLTWWKLDLDVLLLEPLDPKTKDFPKKITFRVQPTKTHHSSYLHAEGTSKGIQACKGAAKKEYNYIYTGKNTDILKFNIEVKHLMFTAVSPAKAEDNSIQANPSINRMVAAQPDKSLKPSGGAPPAIGGNALTTRQDINIGRQPFKQGSGDITTKQLVANEFYLNYVRSGVGNQLNLNLEILGDPFWLPETGASNCHGSGSDQASGPNNTVNHEGTDIWVVVNWRNPADPDAGGVAGASSGLYYFPEGDAPHPLSGLYKVIKVESNFRSNAFTQVLTGFRVPAQDGGGGPPFAIEPGPPESDLNLIYDIPGA